MKLTKASGLWVTAVTLLILTVLISLWSSWQREHFTCQGEVSLFNKADYYEGVINFTFNNGVGRYDTKGFYHVGDEKIIRAEHSLPFKYWKEDGNTIIESKPGINESQRPSALLDIPDFFRMSDRGFILKIIQLDPNTILFKENDIPVLVCQKHFWP